MIDRSVQLPVKYSMLVRRSPSDFLSRPWRNTQNLKALPSLSEPPSTILYQLCRSTSWPPLPTLVHQRNTAPSHLRPSCPITMICIPRPSTLSFSSAANSSESKAVQSAGGCRRLWPWAPCTARTSSPGLRRRSHARMSRLVCWLWMQEKLAPSSVSRGCWLGGEEDFVTAVELSSSRLSPAWGRPRV